MAEPNLVAIPHGKRVKPRYWRFMVITLVGGGLIVWFLGMSWLLVVAIVFGSLNVLICAVGLYIISRQPHTISDERLRLRQMGFFDWPIPTSDLGPAQVAERTHTGRRTIDISGDALVIQSLTKTNVSVPFHEPQLVDLGKSGPRQVQRVEFWADDPELAVREINARTT